MMSPAAIASVMHQHIAFGATSWRLGFQKHERTTPASPRVQRKDVPVHGLVKPLRGRSTSVGLPLKRTPTIPTSTTADLEALANKLEATNLIKMSNADAGPLPRIYYRQSLRPRLLSILANTQDAASAWAAYRALLVLPRSPDKARPKVPFAHRHRLLRLLAAAPRPRPRGLYAQVLSVLRALLEVGGIVKLWEWNFLLDCAGKEGWRRPREEHFRAALALLAEMRAIATYPPPPRPTYNVPGDTGLAAAAAARKGGANGEEEGVSPPDIFSYTTLLAHAVRTRAPAAVRHAAQLLARAGLVPGVHAHTALLCFFARRGDFAGVRDTLLRMRMQQQQEGGDCGDGSAGLSQAAFNVVLWAFAYNGRLDVAGAMYRVVRARVEESSPEHCNYPEDKDEEDDDEEGRLAEREMIVIAPQVVPDIATYHILIQAYAYRGDLYACLEALTDMLTSFSHSANGDGDGGPPISRLRRDNQQETLSTPTTTIFRALFLGFARHGVSHPSSSSSPRPCPSSHSSIQRRHPTTTTTTTLIGSIKNNNNHDSWTLTTLQALFERFLDLPRDTHLRETVLYWLVTAFARTSGNDAAVLRDVFERVEGRFGHGPRWWRGRLARIREKVFSSSCSIF
jgi:hypothetical protein